MISPIAGIPAMLFAAYLAFHILKQEKGDPRMIKISNMIHRPLADKLALKFKEHGAVLMLRCAHKPKPAWEGPIFP